MNEIRAFFPMYITSQSVPAGQVGRLAPSLTQAVTDASSASAQLPGQAALNNLVQIQVANVSTSWAIVNFGVFGAVAAASVATGYPIAPNSVVVVSVDPEVSGATAILVTAAATGSLIYTRGSGL